MPPAMYRSPDGSDSKITDVKTCGSVWMCPICAPKITGERRGDLQRCIVEWTGQGGHVYLLTLTFSHEKDERDLAALMRLHAKALSKLKAMRAYKNLMAAAGSIGSIRALECTYGEMHGWHPHSHDLVFAAPGQLAALKKIRRLWAGVLVKVGLAGLKPGDIGAARFGKLRNLMRYCCDVRSGQYAAEYVAKFGVEPRTMKGGRWGIASELTRGYQKGVRRLSGATPFMLLQGYRDGDFRCGMLFQEFARAFHGKCQLWYSRGLREALKVPDISDDEIAAAPDRQCTEFVKRLSYEEWENVLATNTRFHLVLAAREGLDAVNRFLADIRTRPRTHSGEFESDDAWFDYFLTPTFIGADGKRHLPRIA